MADRHFDPDRPEPTPEEDDWDAAWRDLYETMDAEAPPANPSVADWQARTPPDLLALTETLERAWAAQDREMERLRAENARLRARLGQEVIR